MNFFAVIESKQIWRRNYMSEISEFLGITIFMNFESQDQPNFQALYNGWNGLFSISKLNYSQGNLPPKIVGLVIDWAALHRKELMANWECIREAGMGHKISPLVSG